MGEIGCDTVRGRFKMLLTRLGDGLVGSNDVQAPKSRLAGCDTVRGRFNMLLTRLGDGLVGSNDVQAPKSLPPKL